MMIHIDRGGERMGPYSLEDVNRYLADGTLRPSDLGWYDGAADWAPVTNIEGVVAAGAVPPPTPGAAGSTCPNCQAPVEANQIVCMGCGTRLKEAPAAGGGKGSKTVLIAVGSVVLIAGIVLGVMQPWKKDEENNADAAKPAPPDMEIFEACTKGNIKAVEAHIAAGTDLNQRGPDQITPLITAITFERLDVAKALIKGGAKLDLKNKDGTTALISAAFLGQPEIVKALLEKGADINAKNNAGSTALASAEAPWELAKGILDFLGGVVYGPAGVTLDYEKIKAARPVCAQILRGAGGGGNAAAPAGAGEGTLIDAVFNEDLAAVRKLIAEGANVNMRKADDGSTPLHVAAFVCNIEIVEALIAAKADVNAKNNKGETPLLVVAAPWEAMPGIYGFVGALLQKKFDLERIQKDRVKVAEILRAAGAQ